MPKTEAIFTKEKCLSSNSLMPLQLHLKALLEDLYSSAVIIEMIAMVFVDTVMAQSGQDSSSNPDKGECNLFLTAIMTRTGRQQKCVQWQLKRTGASLYRYCIFCMRQEDSTLTIPLKGSCQLLSPQISSSVKITRAGTGITPWLYILIMWGRLGQRWIKTQRAENKIYMALSKSISSWISLGSQTYSLLQIWDLKQEL